MEKKALEIINKQIKRVIEANNGSEFFSPEEEIAKLNGMIDLFEGLTGKQYKPTNKGLKEI